MIAEFANSWTAHDTWIITTGALAAVACSLLGCFLVLRKQSMMGDAISHAVLPGLAIAFIVTESRGSVVMFIGAAVVGVLTAVFTETVHRIGKVEQNASMGVVFTTLFALGLLLIENAAHHVDLDPGCVLYGALELVKLNSVSVLGMDIPQAALNCGAVTLLNALFVFVCFKELRIATFDPDLATTLGINAMALHYGLMTLVAVTVVACFEAVGSIMVIAMLVVPAATAQLWTKQLGTMLAVAVSLGCGCAVLGHLGAILLPRLVNQPATNTQGMMAVMSGVFLAVAVLLAPQQGIVSRIVRRITLSQRIAAEDILGMLYRLESPVTQGTIVTLPDMSSILRASGGVGSTGFRLALRKLTRDGKIVRAGAGCGLTDAGRAAAADIIRSHRLWEVSLSHHLGVPLHELHFAAEQLEHVTTPAMQQELANSATDSEARDPHGREIPKGR